MKKEIKAWLKNKGTVLWANWDLTDPDDLDLAAEWFHSEIRSFAAAAGNEPTDSPQTTSV